MAKVEDLLNNETYDENDISLYLADESTEPHIVIDDQRDIVIPKELQRIAVQYDHNVETVTFDCPRYWDGHDLTEMRIYINYETPNGTKAAYICDNVRVSDEDENVINFEWTISGNVTGTPGRIKFLVCAKKSDEEGIYVLHWNSELNNALTISEGLECDDEIVELDPDLIEQINNKLDNKYDKSEVDTKFEDYYNKSEVDEKINDISAPDLSNYYMKPEVDDLIAENKSELETAIGMTTGALETEMHENYYTKAEVDDAISNVEVDLTDYYNKNETDSLVNNVKTEINGSVDTKLDNYYNKTEVDEKIDNVSVDLSDYYNKTEVDQKIADIPEPDLSNYYTKTQSDNNLYTKTGIDFYSGIVLENDISSIAWCNCIYLASGTSIKRKESDTEPDTHYGKRCYLYPMSNPDTATTFNFLVIPDGYSNKADKPFLATYDPSVDISVSADTYPWNTVKFLDEGGADLSNYYTKDETYNKTEVDQKIDDIPKPDLSSYTQTFVVNITLSDGNFISDKTAFEIAEAYQSKKYVYAISDDFGGKYELLFTVDFGEGAVAQFSNASNYSIKTFGVTSDTEGNTNVTLEEFELDAITSKFNDYYTKSETYSQSEVDEKIAAIPTPDLSNYYTKSETYTKDEVASLIDEKLGVIENGSY